MPLPNLSWAQELPAFWRNGFLSVKDDDKEALVPLARDLIQRWGSNWLQRGELVLTLTKAGVPVERINKVMEGTAPHCRCGDQRSD
jgi:hypothetical protein